MWEVSVEPLSIAQTQSALLSLSHQLLQSLRLPAALMET